MKRGWREKKRVQHAVLALQALVGPLHAKDSVGCALARLLPSLAHAVPACRRVPLASAGVGARRLALVEDACARPAAAFGVVRADGLESALCPPHRLALVAVVCRAGSPPSSGMSWPACLSAFSGERCA